MTGDAFSPRNRCDGRSAEDVLFADAALDDGAPFCSNPDCALHVCLSDLKVTSAGNWITLSDGRIFGRGRFHGRMVCDACGTRRGPVQLEAMRLSSAARFPELASRE